MDNQEPELETGDGYIADYAGVRMSVIQREDHVAIAILDKLKSAIVWKGEERDIEKAKERALAAAEGYLADPAARPGGWRRTTT
jgi:hypothetical protein